MNLEKTVTYIAQPNDDRCAWWSLIVPEDQKLDGKRINAPFLKRGADLELLEGQFILDSEAVHPRKDRGYRLRVGVALEDEMKWILPNLVHKMYIKHHGGQDLMHESGDVAAAIRVVVWLRRQPNLLEAWKILENL